MFSKSLSGKRYCRFPSSGVLFIWKWEAPHDGSEREDSSIEEFSEESDEETEQLIVVMTLHMLSLLSVLDQQRSKSIEKTTRSSLGRAGCACFCCT